MIQRRSSHFPTRSGPQGSFSSWKAKLALILGLSILGTAGFGIYHTLHRDKYLRINAERLERLNLVERIGAHRVNDQGIAEELLELGIQSLEVDIHYDSETDRYRVGHDAGQTNGTLEEYLTLTRLPEVKKLWLDLKNLSKKNCLAALTRLEVVESRASIKHRSILESSDKSSCLRSFRERNWYTSYYLPDQTSS